MFGLGLTWSIALGFCSANLVQIQASYERFAVAYEKNDVMSMLSILAPDYTLTNAVGVTIDRATYEKQLVSRYMSRETSVGYAVKILSFDLSETGLTVRTRETYSDRKGHSHDYLDHWTWVEGVWKLSSTKTLVENDLDSAPSIQRK